MFVQPIETGHHEKKYTAGLKANAQQRTNLPIILLTLWWGNRWRMLQQRKRLSSWTVTSAYLVHLYQYKYRVLRAISVTCTKKRIAVLELQSPIYSNIAVSDDDASPYCLKMAALDLSMQSKAHALIALSAPKVWLSEDRLCEIPGLQRWALQITAVL